MKKRVTLIVLDSAGIGYLPDAAEFGDVGANTICNIEKKRGRLDVPNMKRLVLVADGGGSNSSNSYVWKGELEKLARKLNIKIEVMHHSPGSSKWNTIEHCLFSMISLHWRGKPMTDIETVVGYIRETTTSGGLTVETDRTDCGPYDDSSMNEIK